MKNFSLDDNALENETVKLHISSYESCPKSWNGPLPRPKYFFNHAIS